MTSVFMLFSSSGITYDISNKHRLGYSEVQLVQCMIDGVRSIHAQYSRLFKQVGNWDQKSQKSLCLN